MERNSLVGGGGGGIKSVLLNSQFWMREGRAVAKETGLGVTARFLVKTCSLKIKDKSSKRDQKMETKIILVGLRLGPPPP